MRVAQCRVLVQEFLRRWFAYAFVLFAAFGVAAYALSAIPMLWALSIRGVALWALAVYSMVAAAALFMCESILWSPSLAEEERYVPVRRDVAFLSDLMLALWIIAPLWTILGAAAWSVFSEHPAWLTATRAEAVISLIATAVLGAVMWAVRMQWIRIRSNRRKLAALDVFQAQSHTGTAEVHVVSLPFAATWLRIGRDVMPGTRSGLLSAFALHACGTFGLVCRPEWAPWFLAITAVTSMSLVRWTAGTVHRESQTLMSESAFLPVTHRSIVSHQRLLILLSFALSLLPMLFVVESLFPIHRPAWMSYVGLTFAAWWWQLTARPQSPATTGFAWLVYAAAFFAFAFEVPY